MAIKIGGYTVLDLSGNTLAIGTTQNLKYNGNSLSVNGIDVKPGPGSNVYNVAVGYNNFGSLQSTAYNNTAIGYTALRDISTGQYNTAIGAATLMRATTSNFNTAVGYAAFANSVSTECVGIGSYAGNEATSASSFVAVGSSAGMHTTTGANCTFIGHTAGSWTTTGSGSVCIGANSQAVDYSAWAAQEINGNNSVVIGYNANAQNGSNTIVIGYGAASSARLVNNQITLGNSSITSLRCAVTSITSLSDARDKSNVTALSYGLDFVNELAPVSFVWDSRDKTKVGIAAAGFLAQDLKQTQTEFSAECLNLVDSSNPDKLEATYGNLIPVLVKAIQDLSTKVESLEHAMADIQRSSSIQ